MNKKNTNKNKRFNNPFKSLNKLVDISKGIESTIRTISNIVLVLFLIATTIQLYNLAKVIDGSELPSRVVYDFTNVAKNADYQKLKPDEEEYQSINNDFKQVLSQDFKVIVDGIEIEDSVSSKAYIDKHYRVMVPLHSFLIQLGYNITWQDENRTVTVKSPNNLSSVTNITLPKPEWYQFIDVNSLLQLLPKGTGILVTFCLFLSIAIRLNVYIDLKRSGLMPMVPILMIVVVLISTFDSWYPLENLENLFLDGRGNVITLTSIVLLIFAIIVRQYNSIDNRIQREIKMLQKKVALSFNVNNSKDMMTVSTDLGEYSIAYIEHDHYYDIKSLSLDFSDDVKYRANDLMKYSKKQEIFLNTNGLYELIHLKIADNKSYKIVYDTNFY